MVVLEGGLNDVDDLRENSTRMHEDYMRITKLESDNVSNTMAIKSGLTHHRKTMINQNWENPTRRVPFSYCRHNGYGDVEAEDCISENNTG